MKMKFIDFIIKGKGVITEMLNRKSARIMRGIDQAIACAQDNADEAREKAESILESLGDASGSGDTDKLCDKINSYADAVELAAKWEERTRSYQKMKEALEKEVDVVEE